MIRIHTNVALDQSILIDYNLIPFLLLKLFDEIVAIKNDEALEFASKLFQKYFLSLPSYDFSSCNLTLSFALVLSL